MFSHPLLSRPQAQSVILIGARGLRRDTIQGIHPRFAAAAASTRAVWRRPNSTSSRRPPILNTDSKKIDSTPSPSPRGSLRDRISKVWSTPTKWYPIPVALGALVLLAVQYRKQARDAPEVTKQDEGGAVVNAGRKVDGPWQVQVLGALPLRSLSQLWGYLNSLVLPVWFRPFGFKLYATIFGCNLDEVPEDLKNYESLGDFFYREIDPAARPIADSPMVSPADGRVLHFGEIADQRVEQVKGITYSLQALLGTEEGAFGERTEITPNAVPSPSGSSTPGSRIKVVDDKNFAEINNIPYSLGKLMGTSPAKPVPDKDLPPKSPQEEHDASRKEGGDFTHDASVAMRLGSHVASQVTEEGQDLQLLHPDRDKLFFCVIYLAPGDYHRFHSPCAWVVERRRHFTGDLFSVSPYIVNRLKDLFVLNERVALLGRWKYGFFSMVPVGATNVGSIRINFDESLRTNTRHMSHPAHTFTEAVYASASLLRGQPLLPGEEMGGFRLGSTIVLVFEAPREWKFTVKNGQKVKVGESLGQIGDNP
ncbi:phosphatidylserine decarboxylase-domain-containing protein [Kockovaella imperatae]|uniref:Phosphatidylserine decarboxylase proenzyme 1, mitochondrial n=1 Tax=Kockovaella imperatae TaxID=4999 RepID=A0A1Y1ULT9_9TREE|nr:phosphatidylserine decarboxylase-domain-containing protein [Kockovaella imperatae]ORX38446.1 phosphatidylserine decarboxylase-domain-containing protein [Kockovaella imperatae]